MALVISSSLVLAALVALRGPDPIGGTAAELAGHRHFFDRPLDNKSLAITPARRDT